VAVRISPEARRDFEALPVTIQFRVREVTERLNEWPNVSGAKPLRYEWKGHFRIRTGDWRVVFRPIGDDVLIVRIANRRDVYED
jgi:mRNA-degrading endonuclease RelE of RelBE toxin-antitoxin system